MASVALFATKSSAGATGRFGFNGIALAKRRHEGWLEITPPSHNARR